MGFIKDLNGLIKDFIEGDNYGEALKRIESMLLILEPSKIEFFAPEILGDEVRAAWKVLHKQLVLVQIPISDLDDIVTELDILVSSRFVFRRRSKVAAEKKKALASLNICVDKLTNAKASIEAAVKSPKRVAIKGLVNDALRKLLALI